MIKEAHPQDDQNSNRQKEAKVVPFAGNIDADDSDFSDSTIGLAASIKG